MPSGWTNKGKFRVLGWVFNAVSFPSNFFGALVQASPAPSPGTDTMGGPPPLAEVPSGNGYTSGGQSLARNNTDFPGITEDDTNNRAFIRIKDLTWTASGGNLGPAAYLVLTDNNTTISSREVFVYFDFNTSVTVSPGQSLTLQNTEMRAI